MDIIHPILPSLNIEITIIAQVETVIEVIEQVIEILATEIRIIEIHIVDLIDTHEALVHIVDINGNIKKSRN